MEFSLLILAVVVFLSILQLTVGMLIGRYVFAQSPKPSTESASAESAPPRSTEEEAGDLRELTQRLHELVASVAIDVDQHQSQIEKTSQELTTAQTSKRDDMADFVLNSVSQVLKVNEKLQSRLQSAEQRLQDQTQEIESHMTAALTDPLTGLPNRRAFNNEMSRRHAEWERKSIPLCLMMLDIDHFKRLNDEYGHPAGDQALRGLADVLGRTIREMDIVSRIGGEEFAAIFPQTKVSDAKRATERIREAVATSPVFYEQTEMQMTVSLGLAMIQEGENPTDLMARADEALYAAKRAGRNRAYFHDGQQCEPVRLPEELAAEFSSFEVETEDLPDYSDLDDSEFADICDDLHDQLVDTSDLPQ